MAHACAGCGLPVIVTPEGPVRGCGCDAPILANMTVTLAGAGGVRS